MPPFWVWLAAFAVAAALPLAWWSLSGARSPARLAKANLAKGMEKVTDYREVVLQQSASERVVSPAMQGMARRARRITPAGLVETLERKIFLAGLSDTWTTDRALALKLLLGIVGAVAGVFLFLASPSFLTLLLAVIITVLLYFAVDAYLYSKADERQQAIESGLADTLDQITVCVEAGLSFEAAVGRAARNRGPLPEELGRTMQDIQLGMPRAAALEKLLDRTDVKDLRTFVHAFSQAERYGIPIAQVLRVQSADLRDKRKQRAEERAMKIPVKLVFPVVLCILPALFVVLAGPAVIRVARAFGAF